MSDTLGENDLKFFKYLSILVIIVLVIIACIDGFKQYNQLKHETIVETEKQKEKNLKLEIEKFKLQTEVLDKKEIEERNRRSLEKNIN